MTGDMPCSVVESQSNQAVLLATIVLQIVLYIGLGCLLPALWLAKNIEFELVRAMRTPRRLTLFSPSQTPLHLHKLLPFTEVVVPVWENTSCSVMRRESDIIRIK